MNVATEERASWDELVAFLRGRTRVVLLTNRADGRMQASPVTGAIDDAGRLLVSSHPSRGKVAIGIEIADWGPIATGGVPPEFAEDV